ncbi:MAG TPA: SDR family NAD(P)-dependent oxidoreductase [Ramlibacter sp.]|nr:SDR family NAD(P)-dependent oxidoreductase [Ramlibacter sp.]
MQSLLQGKCVVVTGGFGALGRVLGQVAMSAGARVALVGRSAAPNDLPSGAIAIGGVDLTVEASTRKGFDEAAAQLGGLDALANVAGGFEWETIEKGSAKTWDRMYEMNVRTALLASQAALPHLLARGAGRIVNVGALAASQAASGMGAYAASKAGVARLTEAMAEELKDRNITVNAVLPSILDTPANRADMPKADPSKWVTPDALARVIVFLMSGDAAPITGALVPVKGRV